MEFKSVYLSRLLGNKIYITKTETLGSLKDLAVDINFKSPKVTVAVIKTKEGIKFIDFDNISISKEKGQYVLTCNKVQSKNLDNYMLLKKYVLDKQIIDVNGRKVVRANDVKLITVPSGTFIAAVDIGMDGLLRRIGIAKPLKRIGIKVSSKLMLWNNIQTSFISDNILLSQSYKKLSTLHPSDLADIIEDFDVNTGAIVFSSLDTAKAADVLEELEEDVQIKLLKTLPKGKAIDVLKEMPTDEAADVLDGLNEDKAEDLLNNIQKQASDEIRKLMKYDENLIGSIMNTDFIACPANYALNNVIDIIRNTANEIDQIYYIYVLDDNNKLIGTVSLKDLIISDFDKKLEDTMNKEIKYMSDTDHVTDLIKIISKYNLFAMPIVDKEMHLIGIVSITDIVYEFTKNKKRYM